MHQLVPAPKFELRSEVEALEQALADLTARVVLVCGERGSGKTALVQNVLQKRPSSGPLVAWRFDLEPDPRALFEALALELGASAEPKALASARGPALAVVDGLDLGHTLVDGDVPRGYALGDLVRAVEAGDGGLRLVLVARVGATGPALFADVTHTVEVRPGWTHRHEGRSAPKWYGAAGDRDLRSRVEAESENGRRLLFMLATLQAPLLGAGLVRLLVRMQDATEDEARSELERLAAQSFLERVPTDAGLAYAIDPLLGCLLRLSENEAFEPGYFEMATMMGVPGGPESEGPRAWQTWIEGFARAGDPAGALSVYANAFGPRRAQVMPSESQVVAASVLVRHFGIPLCARFTGRYPWLDRAVSRIVRGAPARAVSDLRAMQAFDDGDPQLGSTIAEALVDARIALERRPV